MDNQVKTYILRTNVLVNSSLDCDGPIIMGLLLRGKSGRIFGESIQVEHTGDNCFGMIAEFNKWAREVSVAPSLPPWPSP